MIAVSGVTSPRNSAGPGGRDAAACLDECSVSPRPSCSDDVELQSDAGPHLAFSASERGATWLPIAPSLAVMPCGSLVSLVQDDLGGRLVASRWIPNAWQRFLVEQGSTRAGDLAVDAAAGLHAVYVLERANGDEQARLARAPDGQAWTSEALGGWLRAGTIADVALAVEPRGSEHVAVLAADGCWILTPDPIGAGLVNDHVDSTMIDWDGSPRVSVAIAVGSGGALHVAWVVPDPLTGVDETRNATNRDGDWFVETLGAGRGWADLALDRHDRPHVTWDSGRGARHASLARVDGIDENCDGVDGVDADGDGHASRETGGDDPDDTDPNR